ncbi:hypothetical protein WA026_006381 [Henosepilachna vigintioctopunctata]|uniref:Uncharacterized protein n=1 Tax=Henosepilachna vigintioctopunctata TaxID=420089 RepID=A0AAW1TPL1_9CUCU
MEDNENEVMFLLRLKPTSIPTVNKSTKDVDASNASRKWDIMIEQHSSDVESVGSHQNSPVAGRRFHINNHRPLERERSNTISPTSNMIFNDMGYPRETYNSNKSHVTMHRFNVGVKSHLNNFSQEAPPLPPRWQPSAPPQEEDVHAYPKPDSSYMQQLSPPFVGDSSVSYFNFPKFPLHDLWLPENSLQAPLSPTLEERCFQPAPFVDFRTPQNSTSLSYSNGDISARRSGNSIPTETSPNSAKPPFSPSTQAKSVRPPKPSPRSSAIREYRGVNERNVATVSVCLEFKAFLNHNFCGRQWLQLIQFAFY